MDHYLLECKLLRDRDACKEVLKDLRCEKHKLKARVAYDYDDCFTKAHLTQCCCPEFAKQVAHALKKAQTIDVVDLDGCKYTRVG